MKFKKKKMEMGSGKSKYRFFIFMAALFISSHPVLGIRFVIDKEECFSHNVEFIRDTIYLSFVVVSVHTWRHHAHNGVDLLVTTFINYSSFFFSLRFV